VNDWLHCDTNLPTCDDDLPDGLCAMQIDIREQPAMEVLQMLLQHPEGAGSFDFVFIGE